MDFLGLRNLSIIDDTLTAVKRVYNRTIRLNQIPLDDETTLALFRKGKQVVFSSLNLLEFGMY